MPEVDTLLNEIRGHSPYGTELFGVYQPLLGWRANQPSRRVERERTDLANRVVMAMLGDARVRTAVGENPRAVGPDAGFRPRVAPGLAGLAANRLQEAALAFVNENRRLPAGADEWAGVLQQANLNEALAAISPRAQCQDVIRIDPLGLVLYPTESYSPTALEVLGAHPIPGTGLAVALASSQAAGVSPLRESVIAGTLDYLGRTAPAVLAPFLLTTRRPWETAVEFIDPLAGFTHDPLTQQAVLSPVGLVHLYREYFFELKPFLGSPVGHIWVSPGGTVELFEVNTRRTVVEREIQTGLEVVTRSELIVAEQDELSDAIKRENQNNVSMGITASGGGNWGVYEASASVNYDITRAQATAEEHAHKHVRTQSERLSNEMRRSFKTTLRTSVEVTDTSSRRHVIQNTTDRLVNYELRRKMRRVAVQVQHLGTQVCWQVYVDEPGRDLGLAGLIHVAKPEDVTGAQPPEAPAPLAPKEADYQADFPFQRAAGDPGDDDRYFNGDNHDGDHIVWQREYMATPPGLGYTLGAVRQTGIDRVNPDEDPPEVAASFHVTGPGTFRIDLNEVHFHEQTMLRFHVKLIWNPPDQSAAMADYQKKLAEYTAQRDREVHEQYVTAVRERVKLASKISPRPADDLREEERTVVFRRLISQLIRASGQTPHVTAELIRSIFDVDKMLYFVAPEWWKPRLQDLPPRRPFLPPPVRLPAVEEAARLSVETHVATPPPEVLTESDRVGWNGKYQNRPDNYMITEDSNPAPLGASLGWLLQLDGDSHRNAFLNSPWVKAVIPIRPGKEVEALEWLKLAQVEGTEGLDFRPAGPPGPTIGDQLRNLTEHLSSTNTNMQSTLATETVFTHGFDPLAGGFRDDTNAGRSFQVFDQWVEILPTDQIVAVEVQYDPNNPG